MTIVGMGIVCLIAPELTITNAALSNSGLFPALENVAGRFSFAVFSDPQVGHIDSTSRVYRNARRTQILAIKEINAMKPMPVFALFLGDIVNVPDRASFDNFVDCVKEAKMQKIWVHGNHDTRPPYTLYREYQKTDTGHEEVFFSWDVGNWHMVALPCNLDGGLQVEKDTEAAMLSWLEKDLEANKDRPTMVFEHLHLVPVGLSQLEWYTFRLELRMRLLDILAKYGNVKWYFNGHVHNGMKAAVKMAKCYKGINFITCPTIIEGRNFGEEFEKYEHALATGGYYLIVDVDGEDVTLKGRVVDVPEVHIFPKDFPEFTEEDEPRWFKRVVDFEPVDKVVNGGFENGFDGWHRALRYISDEHPAFDWVIDRRYKRSGDQSMFILSRAKGREFWARDDNTPVYQVVKAPKGPRPIFKASYYLEKRPANAGAYVRISGISGKEFKFLMLFKWGQNENRADFLPRCMGYEIYGIQQSWAFLSELGCMRQAFFWDVLDDPGKWHDLTVDIADMYDRCYGELGAFEKLGITKYHISLGTWTNPQAGSESGAYFDNVDLTAAQERITSKVGNRILPVNEHVFITRFGQDLKDDVDRKLAHDRGQIVVNPPKGEIRY